MVTDGILDALKEKVADDVMTKLQTWYVEHLHDKVKDAGITNLTIAGWTEVMENVDMQSVCKNGRYFDLIDADTFNLALTKYIESPHEDVDDLNFFTTCTLKKTNKFHACILTNSASFLKPL